MSIFPAANKNIQKRKRRKETSKNLKEKKSRKICAKNPDSISLQTKKDKKKHWLIKFTLATYLTGAVYYKLYTYTYIWLNTYKWKSYYYVLLLNVKFFVFFCNDLFTTYYSQVVLIVMYITCLLYYTLYLYKWIKLICESQRFSMKFIKKTYSMIKRRGNKMDKSY